MISCEEIRDVLDAYALGAADSADSRAIEEHVADCVRCWEELSKAQRTAALLALSAPVREAPEGLGERIMEAAGRERPIERTKLGSGTALSRVRVGWPAAAGVLGLAAAAALAFASFLQIQMNDLRNDKDELAVQLDSTRDTVEDQAQVITISVAGDTQEMMMEAVASPEDAWGEYFWSRSAGAGFIVCHDMPALPDGEVYQAWFDVSGAPVSAGTFRPNDDGGCMYPMKPEEPVRGADGVGVSVEQAGGSDKPSSDWLDLGIVRGELELSGRVPTRGGSSRRPGG